MTFAPLRRFSLSHVLPVWAGVLLAGLFLLSGCSTMQPMHLAPVAALPPAESELWTQLDSERSEDWFHLLNDGDAALEWRLRLIDSATESLDLQTFLWKKDTVGLRILQHVLVAADRGVRVRILLDDTFTINEGDVLAEVQAHPLVDVRVYNPYHYRPDSFALRQLLNAGEFSRVNHRMHNKGMMVDNRAGIVGGRNLADEYFGKHERSNLRDMEVLLVGDFVSVLSAAFDGFWNSGWAIPVESILSRKALRSAEQGGATPWVALAHLQSLELESAVERLSAWGALARTGLLASVTLLGDAPAHHDPAKEIPDQLAKALALEIDKAERELIVVTAYLVPTPHLEAAVERAEARGVRVRVLTNSLRSNNHTTAHAAYRHHIGRLMEHGAELHEVRALAKDRARYMDESIDSKHLGLHAKVLLIDDHLVFIGSLNLDPRSLHLNTEMGLLIDSTQFNQWLRKELELDFSTRNAWRLETTADGDLVWVGDDVTLTSQPAESKMQRIEDWFFGLLPIDEEM